MTDENRKEINITRWFPDTCSCALEYSWEEGSSEDERIHTPHKVVDTCPHHDHLRADLHGHHTAVHGENSHKNLAVAHALEHLPDEHKQELLWSFNDKRELELTLRHASGEVKAHVADRLKEKFTDRITHVK